MTQDTLFLLLVTISGVYAVRWSLRLAPLWSEFPAKTSIATALSALVTLGGVTSLSVSAPLRFAALVVGPLYVFGPLALVALARARRYRPATVVADILYWTPEGRAAVRRLLAQAALQQGDAEAALRTAPEHDALLLAQAHALKGDWEGVLELDLPRDGDNAFLGDAARIEALVALGRVDEARTAVSAMRSRWEAGVRGPIGYRSLVVSEARVKAEEGDFEGVRDALQQPMAGVRAHTLYGVLGRAAERAGLRDAAVKLYVHAYQSAPPGTRERYGDKLRLFGQEPPPLPRSRTAAVATLSLAAALVLAYAVQNLADRGLGTVRALGQSFQVSTFTGAFMLGLPAVPSEHAWWRMLTYAFLHANLVHIGFNVWVLVDLGRIYEQRRGWGNLLVAFVAGTIMGAYLTSLAQAHQPLVLVGASGGILGVAGALLADVMRSRAPADRVLLRGLLQWMVLIALFSVAVPGVSLWGHAGGVVGGILWGLVRQGIPAGRRFDEAAGAAAALITVAALALAVATAVRVLS